MTEIHTGNSMENKKDENMAHFLSEYEAMTKLNSSSAANDEEIIDKLFDTSSLEQDKDSNGDEFEFKPLTTGLGFHKENGKENRGDIVHREERKSHTKENRKTVSRAKASHEAGPESYHRKAGELSAFYGAPSLEETTEKELSKKTNTGKSKPKRKALATKGSILSAFFVDIIAIVALEVLLLGALVISLGAEASQVRTLFSSTEMMLYGGIIFSFLYVFYFTILDLGGTVGKSLFSLSVVKTGQSRLTVFSTFTRSIVSLLSLILLGIPMLFDFHGKLSDTEVIKEA